MIKICKVFVFSLLSLSVCFTTYAQKAGVAADADKALNTFQYNLAAEMYKSLWKGQKKSVEKRRIMFRMAECYIMSGRTKQAKQQYLRLEKVNYQKIIR